MKPSAPPQEPSVETVPVVVGAVLLVVMVAVLVDPDVMVPVIRDLVSVVKEFVSVLDTGSTNVAM
jgi:hypothetical protein